ncbi:hypothetical protein L218DRAFT_251846 [Marasmius fiardii PR-910]|nr:hypothetical protein L218DRAFT_251846 [Marasmius fiardii PR-910]
MSNPLSNTPSFPEDRRLAGADNYRAFKDYVISTVRSKTLLGYLNGTIPHPTAASGTSQLLSQISSAPNSATPTPEEWEQRKGWVAGVIYQNINDPDAHGIRPSESAVDMWAKLRSKFETSTQLLKNIAEKHLDSLKMEETGHIDTHLETLEKLRSLPPSWVLVVQLHQGKTNLDELTAALREYWIFIHRDDLASIPSTDPTALATTSKSKPNIDAKPTCQNCGVPGHSHDNCWAAGGGKEGKAPKWWKAPKGKEPRVAPQVAVSQYSQQQPVAMTSASTTSPTAASVVSYTPLETYALGDISPTDLDCIRRTLDW